MKMLHMTKERRKISSGAYQERDAPSLLPLICHPTTRDSLVLAGTGAAARPGSPRSSTIAMSIG